MRPGCYEQKGRLEDMDVNWVEASLSFPTFPRFCGQTFEEADDKELANTITNFQQQVHLPADVVRPDGHKARRHREARLRCR